jgi:folate-binding protein YgfZ
MSEIIEQVAARRLALEETHRRAGAVLVERDGYLLPASYGDAATEYEAVRGGDSAGLIDLSARGRVEVSGKEAVQFLNGLITNDVKTLAPGAWMSAAFPNPQGRLLAVARVVRAGDAEIFLFDTEAATHATVLRNLERFTLAGDFKVRDLTGETAQLSVQGVRGAEIVRRVLGGSAARIARGRVAVIPWRESRAVTLLRATHTGEDGFDLVIGVEGARSLWDALTSAGARPVGDDALEVLRVEAGLARYGVDATEANVVLEAGIDDAVSYTKGCYVGQEIIARIHWRGHVAKKLAGLTLEYATDVAHEDASAGATGEIATGAKIKTTDGSREIGRATSVAFSPRLRKRIALGIVKYDFLAPGTEVLIDADGGARVAKVSALPFVRGSWHDAAESEGAQP